jgi:hypothetical protein
MQLERDNSGRLEPPSIGESMPTFKLPLSGNVTQAINPWTMIFSPTTSYDVGEVNINLGKSTNPAVEAEVLTDVASYGTQLDRIEEVLFILIEHFRPDRPLTPAQAKSIADFRRMMEEIAVVKHRHGVA